MSRSSVSDFGGHYGHGDRDGERDRNERHDRSQGRRFDTHRYLWRALRRCDDDLARADKEMSRSVFQNAHERWVMEEF
jgi:hypothetical protein